MPKMRLSGMYLIVHGFKRKRTRRAQPRAEGRSKEMFHKFLLMVIETNVGKEVE